MTMDRADVVVIGGGVIGLSSAYFLCQRGLDVALVDKGIPGWEASGRNGGHAVGYAFEEPRIPLVKEAIKIWQTLDEELGSPTEFVMGGNLTIGMTEEDIWFEENQLELNQKWGITTRKVDLAEMREILPGVTDRALGGIFTTETGQANPQLTSQAWLWGIQRNGGRVHQNTTVTGVSVTGGRVSGVETTRGNIGADIVLNAAGPWANLVSQMTGKYLPVAPVKIQIMCTLPSPPITRATFSGNGLYCRQAASGHMHFGAGKWQQMDLRKTTEKPTSAFITRGIAKRYVELVPGMAHLPVLRTWAGIMDATPDHLPIVDKLDYPEGMYVNVAYGGVGFSNSPGAGKAISELIVDGQCSFDISAFNAGRFADVTEFDPDAEL